MIEPIKDSVKDIVRGLVKDSVKVLTKVPVRDSVRGFVRDFNSPNYQVILKKILGIKIIILKDSRIGQVSILYIGVSILHISSNLTNS